MDELTAAMKAREFLSGLGKLALPVSMDVYAKAAGATVSIDDLQPGESGWSFQA